MRTWVRPDGRRFVLGEPDGELPPGELYAVVDEADAKRRAALETLGFAVHRRELELMLPTGLSAVAAPGGVRAVRADELPETELRLLDDELRRDVPGTDGWRWRPADFREETYGSPHFDPAVYLVAVADGFPAGICRVWNRPERPRLGFIGVVRTHRRRGTARWLIGETFAVLAARGHAEARTEVDETNAASRMLLEGLGGRVVGASLELIRGPGITIRAASGADVPALSELATRTWLDAFGDSVPPAQAAAEVGRSRSEARFGRALVERTILVAERDGRLAAYAELGDVDVPEVAAGPGDGELHRLYVETALHGQGIGRRLAAAALAHTRLARAPRVYLRVWERNERALRLYESLGFRLAGRTAFTIGAGEPAEDLVLVLAQD